VTGAAAAVTDAATLYIAGAPAGTVTGANWSLWLDAGNARLDGNLLFGSDAVICRNTTDGSDSGTLSFNGGGASGVSRGAGIILYGNETTAPHIDFKVGNSSSARYRFYDPAGTSTVFTMLANTGAFTHTSSDINYFESSYGSDRTPKFMNSHGSTPYGIQVQYTGAAPNNTGSEFIYCPDTSGLRMSVRSNGGIANYQANDVNLSDDRRKRNVRALNIEPVWTAHKKMRDVWCLYEFTDQTHSDSNVGYVAQRVREVWKDVAPWLVDVFDDGAGADGMLGVYDHDLKNLTCAVVTELQWRSDDHETRIQNLEKGKAA
jgi:hypothetical protein